MAAPRSAILISFGLSSSKLAGLMSPMDDALELRVVEGAAALEHVFHHAIKRQQVIAMDEFFQRAAGYVFHHDVIRFLAEYRFVSLDDVRMDELACQRGFVRQLLAVLSAQARIVQEFPLDQLDGDFAILERVVSQIDRTGPALSQFLDQAVGADIGFWLIVLVG